MYLKCYVVIHGGGLVVPISDVRTLNRTIQWRLPFHGPNLGHLCWTYCTVTNFQASTISEAGPLKPFARGGILKSNPRRSHHRFNHDIFLDVYTAGSNDDTRPSRTHILKPESVGTWFIEPLRIATNRHQAVPIIPPVSEPSNLMDGNATSSYYNDTEGCSRTVLTVPGVPGIE